LELRGLLLVEQLEADGAAQAPVAGAPHLGHAALSGAAQQVEALAHIDARQLLVAPPALAAEQRFQLRQKTHGIAPSQGSGIRSQGSGVRGQESAVYVSRLVRET